MTQDRFSIEGAARITVAGQSGTLPPVYRDLIWALENRRDFGLEAADGPAIRLRPPAPDGRPMMHCQTSGSMGRPKIIRRSQLSWIASFRENARLFGIGPGDRVAVLGPMVNSLALYAATEALLLGAAFDDLGGLPPHRQLPALVRNGATVLYATPTQLRLLVRAAMQAPQQVPTMRHILCGGGPFDAPVRDGLAAPFPNAEVHEFFGAAETSFITLSDRQTATGSVGRPYPGVTLEIRDEGGAVTPGAGEIWVKSRYLFDGYEGGAIGGAQRDGDFLAIGEIGQLSADGELIVLGRKDRATSIADHVVHPEAVERVLMQDDAVGLCAVIAVPDGLRGHALVAVLSGAEDTAVAQRLRRACKDALPPTFQPKRFVFLQDFPLLPGGKPDLARLADIVGEAV